MYCRNCGEAMNDNQAVCLKCGVEAGTGNSFCPNCGNAVTTETVSCTNCGSSLEKKKANKANLNGIKKKSIEACILFSILTCGIYGIYWFICLTNDMNKASGKTEDTNGGIAFLLSLFTCSIYGAYWAYKMGEKRDIITGEKTSANITYLVFSIILLPVVCCLAQDALNKAIDENK